MTPRSNAAQASTVLSRDALPEIAAPVSQEPVRTPLRPLTVLIAVPTVEIGAADEGAVDIAAILAAAGHHPIVVSGGGRLESRLAEAGADIVRLDMGSRNPVIMARNAAALMALMRARRCDVVHAHGRAPAWSAYVAARMAGVPFLTSWYKGFREQNALKRFYNGVMARGDRVITVSDQIAELIVERHGTPWERISVIPAAIDFDRFDPAALTIERVNAIRRSWGVEDDTKVVLVVGRMLRRKGHHVVVQAARRLKNMGLTDFLFVFAGEDQGRTRYAGEVWDVVLSTDTADVIRMAPAISDMPAAYAASTALLSAAVQAEGVQRAILEGLAMARPVVVSDLAAGSDIVLAPPAVPEDRMTGVRFRSGDDAALASALIQLFSMPEAGRRAIGRRGRDWALANCNPSAVTDQVLAIYAAVAGARH